MFEVQLLYLNISNATKKQLSTFSGLNDRPSTPPSCDGGPFPSNMYGFKCEKFRWVRATVSYLHVIVVQLLYAQGNAPKRTRVFTHSGCQVARGLPDIAGLASRSNDFVDTVAVEHFGILDLSDGRAVFIFRTVQIVVKFADFSSIFASSVQRCHVLCIVK